MIDIPSFLKRLLNKAKSLVMEEMNPDLTSGQPIAEAVDTDVLPETPVPQPAPDKKMTRLKVLTAILNGLGIGLLLGLLISLSLSPVVSGVVAALTGLLAVLLGLDEKYISPLKSIRIGTFGLAATAGIIFGLYIRASNPFAPTLVDKLNLYQQLGYTEEEARAFVTKFIDSDTGSVRREAPILYSSTIDASACDVLQYATTDQSATEVVNTFREAGGTWKELAEAYQADLPQSLQSIALISIRDCFCSLASDGVIKMTDREKIARLGQHSSLDEIELMLSSADQGWKAIMTKFSSNIPADSRKEAYLSTIKVLTHD